VARFFYGPRGILAVGIISHCSQFAVTVMSDDVIMACVFWDVT